MKKTLALFVLLVCAAVLFCTPAFAADSGYVIENYTVEATLHENNTVTQTETISVNFLEPSRGIFRAFPQVIYVDRTLDGTTQTMAYRCVINDIAVSGTPYAAPYTAYTEDDYFYIRIGEENSFLSGRQTYTLSFTYDIGDDRIDAYDELFYSILGSDWDTRIENFQFNLRFDAPLPAESVTSFALHSGTYGSTGNNADIVYTVSDKEISGSSTTPLAPNTAVTLFAFLPEGYFTGERTAPVWAAYLLFGLCGLYGAWVALQARKGRKRPVATVEFYPPNGISSAEVGYILDDTADEKDVLSLIVWFASQGYLTIEDEGDGMLLRKVRNLPSDAPQYQKTFFEAIFDLRDTFSTTHPSEKFCEQFHLSLTQLQAHFQGERALYERKSYARAFGKPTVVLLLWMLGAVFASGLIESGFILVPCLAFVALFLLLCMRLTADSKYKLATRGSKIGYWAGFICLGSLGALCVGGTLLYSIIPLTLSFVCLAIWFVCLLFCPNFIRDTPYRLDNMGKLLGLRTFIQKAELPRIQALAEQDPAYFYNILPYAYVMNLTNIWVKQFETLAVSPPVWYCGAPSMWDILWMDRMMRYSLSEIHQSVQTASQTSGGHGGTSFGGGGGYSGGGFGGGGGGRW